MALRWIVKLGGSLTGDAALREWLSLLTTHAGDGVVVVPGGGDFADQVRDLQPRLGYDDAAAHDMAVLAMAQMACMLHSLAPSLAMVDDRRSLRETVGAGRVAVWRPLDVVRERSVAPGWDITSDSFAVWLAAELDVDGVILVKSCAIPSGDDAEPEALAAAGIVDARLPALRRARPLDLRLVSRDTPALADGWLRQRPQPRPA